MASGSISLSNIQNTIELFNKEFIQCNKSFSKIEDDFIQLKCENQRHKSEIKESLSDMQSDLLRNLKKIDNLNQEEYFYIENCETHLDEYNNVLESFKKKLTETVTESKVFKEIFFDNYKGLKTPRDTLKPKETKFDGPNKINAHVLHSRQTDNPFIILKLKSGLRKCNGCNKPIPIQSLYLSHIEEYPSGSKSFKPHAYHVNQKCLFHRGFEVKYLKKIKVASKVAVDHDFDDILTDIGFQKKNILLTISHINDSDSDSESDNKNSDSDFPDNVSEASNVSSVPSTLNQNIPCYKFLYHRKPTTQKRVITCQGCQTNIETDTYISLETNCKSIPFHIQKNCLKTGGVLPENFSRTKCMAYKLLSTHNELKELIACGFYYNKIMGYRPPNPINQQPLHKNAQKQNKHEQNTDQTVKNPVFIFNEEPFYYELLIHGERCRGCQEHILKNDMSLRHRERVPREKLGSSPLTSQYYHAKKECLLKRGFTFKYLAFIQCKAILSGENNISRVTEALIHCGFYTENIIYSPKETSEPRGFEVNTQPTRPVLENKLFIDNCMKSSAHCEGCGFVLMPNQPCFIYSSTPEQNSNAKFFHIKSNCLKVHFTKDQIMATSCITNNLVDVSPNDIINCGIVKIVTESTGTSQRNPINVQPFKPRTFNDSRQRPPARKKPAANPLFNVMIVSNQPVTCCGCHQPIQIDRYGLRIHNRPPNQSMVHVDPNCVAKIGLKPVEIANSELVFCQLISSDCVERLRDCGFRKFPNH